MCPHARTPGCLATFDGLDVGTYSYRGPGADKTSWTGCSYGYSHGHEKHKRRAHEGGMTGRATTFVQPAP